MYSESELESAIAHGVLSRDAASAFRAHVAATRQTPLADEEQVRLLTGFNDIFVSIAAGLLLGALAFLGENLVNGDAALPVSSALVAGASWLLAEFFTRRRHMALPSILLLLSFVAGLFGIGAGIGHMMQDAPYGVTEFHSIAAGGLLAALGAYMHWRRFMVPITIAAGAVAALGLVMASAAAALPALRTQEVFLGALFTSGLLLFALAMRWDMTDPERRTRRTDVAFWLHLAAAPMIVHPAFRWLGVLEQDAGWAAAIAGLCLYIVLTFSALLVDRRALMVSALVYVLAALSTLLEQAGALSLSTALTALVLGSGLLLLSAFWQGVRAWILGLLPLAISRMLPAGAQGETVGA